MRQNIIAEFIVSNDLYWKMFIKCELVVLDSEGHVCDDVCRRVIAWKVSMLHEKWSFGVWIFSEEKAQHQSASGSGLDHQNNRPTLSVATVKTLITHTCRWTVQGMGFQGLWVGGGGKKISAQEIWRKFLRKSYFLCYNQVTMARGTQKKILVHGVVLFR